MHQIVAYMIGYDRKYGELVYVTRDIITDKLPENTHQGMVEMLSACNSHKLDPDIEYVDMYGYSYEDEDILWEDDYEM